MMNIKTLKLISLGMMIIVFIIIPYQEIYEACIEECRAVDVPSWFLHGFMTIDFVFPMLLWKIYPFAVGLFDARGASSIRENIKAKRHWIIIGMSIMLINSILSTKTRYDDTAFGMIVGIWLHIIYVIYRFSVMYTLGLLFTYLSRESIVLKDRLKEKIQQKLNRSA